MLLLLLLIFLLPSPSCTAAQSRQKRSWIIDSYEIEEENPGPFPYVLGQVTLDRKYRVLFNLKGQGVDEDPKDVLSINESTGQIFVSRPVDFEEYKVLKLSFEAKNPDDYSIDTRLGVEIAIRDINDNPPLFDEPEYNVTVEEALSQGSHLLTVLAFDRDEPNTPNSTFHYAIKSVSPESSNIEFVLKKNGALSFKGCFDHEVASEHMLVIEAVDHGEVVQLSSSTTAVIQVKDSNDHLPVITGRSVGSQSDLMVTFSFVKPAWGSGKVKENEFGVSPLRLHVTDEDMAQSKAWRAKYTIQGDEKGYFKIETDPETNDGILTVVKSLDFEDGAMRELKISVENEAPYFSCKVKRRTSGDLWDVDFTEEQIGDKKIQHDTTTVVIEVEDVNDPPNFDVTVKEVSLQEDAPIGTWLEKVTAVDRDTTASRDFIYKVGHDPAGWMDVDPQTGDITTRQMVDRESDHVVDGVYTLILHAVDEGEPPMTGTATLQIHLADVNDNVPKLEVSQMDVCLSDGQTPTNISATDLDSVPYGGPFNFELLGDIEGQWKLDPSQGFTAGLVRDSSVQSGLYTLRVKVTDMQGTFDISELTATVCPCLVEHHCRNWNNWKPKTINFSGAVGVALVAAALFLLALLAVVLDISPKKTKESCAFKGYLMSSNTEAPGDAMKAEELLFLAEDRSWRKQGNRGGDSFINNGPWRSESLYSRSSKHWSKGGGDSFINNGPRRSESVYSRSSKHWSKGRGDSFINNGPRRSESVYSRSSKHWSKKMENINAQKLDNSMDLSFFMRNASFKIEERNPALPPTGNLYGVNLEMDTRQGMDGMKEEWKTNYQFDIAEIERKLSRLQESMAELHDYEPQIYEEEELSSGSELDYLDICFDHNSFAKLLDNLGPEFNGLAACVSQNHRDENHL